MFIWAATSRKYRSCRKASSMLWEHAETKDCALSSINFPHYNLLMTKTTDSTIQVRRSADRFHSDLGWLDSRHTFSFGNHHDPAFMGFKALRVINDDRVAPNQGFGEHGHAGMEIISYVISGQLQHRDSMGNGHIIEPGQFQYMSAGTGVRHSEFNPPKTEPVHFLQIWITPRDGHTKPRYEERSMNELPADGSLTLVASADGRDGSIAIHQDVIMSFGHLASGEAVRPTTPDSHHWVHVISGKIQVHGETLSPGDGAA
ncbi:MAG: pirin family protein, partial [Verrucomicrobiaceae bacterium]